MRNSGVNEEILYRIDKGKCAMCTNNEKNGRSAEKIVELYQKIQYNINMMNQEMLTGVRKEGGYMGLFGKKEEKNYIVFDPYTEEAVAACTTKEVKQIIQVQPKAKFVECTSYEFFKFKEHNVLPDNISSRQKLDVKDVK